MDLNYKCENCSNRYKHPYHSMITEKVVSEIKYRCSKFGHKEIKSLNPEDVTKCKPSIKSE
jgi:hypothetical protein